MAFPSVLSITEYKSTTSINDHPVVMPATVNSGDLLYIIIAKTNSAGVTSNQGITGWDHDVSYANVGGTTRVDSYKRKADGSEGGTTVHVVGSSSSVAYAVAQTYRITSWYGDTNFVSENHGRNSSTSTPDPGSLSPGYTSDMLWIAGFAKASTATLSSYSTNYTDGLYTYNALSTSQPQLATERRLRTTNSENPGPLTISAAADVVYFTINVAESSSATQTVTPTKLSVAPTFYTPTFSFGEVSRTATKLSIAPTIPTPTALIQTHIDPVMLDLTPTFPMPVLLMGNNAAPTIIDNILYIIPPTFVPGSVTRTPVKLNVAPTFHNAELANVLKPTKLSVTVAFHTTALIYAASPSAIERAIDDNIHTPTFQLLPVSISPSVLSGLVDIHTPDISNPGWSNTDVYSTETWTDTDVLM